MTYQIDQSGKIEQTSKATIITIANGYIKTIKINGVEKRKLIKAMVELDYPKLNYMHKMFASLIFILLKDSKLKEVIIDREYPHHEADIKNMLLNYFSKEKLDPPIIHFQLIGKRGKAHVFGIETYRGKRKANIIVNSQDLLKVIYGKVKKGKIKGWRSQSS